MQGSQIQAKIVPPSPSGANIDTPSSPTPPTPLCHRVLDLAAVMPTANMKITLLLGVAAAREAGGSAEARQPSFAKALGVPGPPPRCPRKVSSAEGAAKGAQEEVTRLSAKPAPAKVETKPKKAAGKGKSSDKKSANKGEKGAKGKQTEVANQETKEDLPAENRETKNKESPASDEAGEKEAKSN
ncbi:non-histone chromosomal protein HMG-14-like [Neomonachus schauinslandi]|uniref:Non-histone chromosomal protein HMG-14-like n=1 Tax=Neomonachus schauinslandi TaxID=29088 RepID=A0A8M1MH99_NEOSC|nr:non-histone chromosomal protein HMG-14-like [Neomonachus schauinslandi]